MDNKKTSRLMLAVVDSSSTVESTRFLAAAGERQRYGTINFFGFPLNTRAYPDL